MTTALHFDKTKFQYILDFFENLGFPLEHFEEDENEDLRECWQHDGTDSYGRGVVIQIYLSLNGRGEPSVFGEADFSDVGGECISLAFPLATWLEDGPDWVRKNMGRG